MIILGIDPGTQRMGFGVVERASGPCAFVDAGIIPTSGKDAGVVLHEIKRGIDGLLDRHQPAALAIEQLFFSKNQKTAIRVAEARGVVLLAAAEHGVPIMEYGPNQIKTGIAGYGNADKRAVLKMVRLLLRMPDLDLIDDASDALAIALHAAQDLRLRRTS